MQREPSLLVAVTCALTSVLTCALAAPGLAQDRSVVWQVAAAVLPLPDSMRAGAEVLGWQGGRLARLRAGRNEMICLSDDPKVKGFQASCYHRSLEPFMARGRALRAAGITERNAVDSARLADIRRGRIAMPRHAAMLVSLFADEDAFDAVAGPPARARKLHVIYLPYATEQTTGISAAPAKDRPWLMYGGKPWAHVMLP